MRMVFPASRYSGESKNLIPKAFPRIDQSKFAERKENPAGNTSIYSIKR